MKKLFIICITAVLASCSVPMELVKLEESSKTITANDTRENLFVKSNLWLVDYFNNAKSVIQYSDKEAGVIAGKFHIYHSGSSVLKTEYVEASFKIFIKDNNARIFIKPEPYNKYQSYGTRGRETQNMVQEIIDALLISYEDYLNKNILK